MFRELFETQAIYIVDFEKKLNKNELKDLNRAGKFEVNGKEIETTDKKVYNKILDIADEIGLKYQNFVELIK